MSFVPQTPATATILSLIALGTVTGFVIGRFSAPTDAISAKDSKQSSRKKKDIPIEANSDDEADDHLQSFGGRHEECKLVLVVRTDLGMTKGKIAAQCSHATLACYKALVRQKSPILQRWESLGQAKIAVQTKSEDDLLMLQAQAISLGVCAKVIHDAGRTQITSGSATVLGVGPAPKSVIDQITGHLKLL